MMQHRLERGKELLGLLGEVTAPGSVSRDQRGTKVSTEGFTTITATFLNPPFKLKQSNLC